MFLTADSTAPRTGGKMIKPPSMTELLEAVSAFATGRTLTAPIEIGYEDWAGARQVLIAQAVCTIEFSPFAEHMAIGVLDDHYNFVVVELRRFSAVSEKILDYIAIY